jgi:hypothetical protein
MSLLEENKLYKCIMINKTIHVVVAFNGGIDLIR